MKRARVGILQHTSGPDRENAERGAKEKGEVGFATWKAGPVFRKALRG